METRDDWARKVASEINKVERYISPSDQRRYKLPLLLRLAQRVAAFSHECEVCLGLQSQITSLGADLSSAPWMNRKNFRSYLGVIKGISQHLKRRHGLAEERQYVKRFLFMGLAIGLFLVALSLVLLSFGTTLLALNVTVPALIGRVIFGYTIGHILDKRARSRGKVL